MHQGLPPLRIHDAVIALVLPLGIWLATVGLMSYEPTPGNIDIASGRGIFRDRCGACHILEKGPTTHHGPSLHDIGRVSSTRKPGFTAAEYILESILEPEAFVAPQNRKGMPRNLASELSSGEIRNIVAFLSGHEARPNYDDILKLEIPEQQKPPVRIVRRDDMELAEHLLQDKGGCLHCHSLYRNAEHQLFAPGLFEVGLVDKQLVRESIVDPNKVVSPDDLGIEVLLVSGKVVLGKLMSQDDDRLIVLARDDQNRPVRMDIAMSEIETEDGQPMIRSSEMSPMPTGLDKLLTPEELEALITMIWQLN